MTKKKAFVDSPNQDHTTQKYAVWLLIYTVQPYIVGHNSYWFISVFCCRTIFVAIHEENVDWLIVWCLTPFSTIFQLYHSAKCTYPCFPKVLHNILSKPLAAFQPNHSRSKGVMIPVTMTIINPHKEYWPSRRSSQRSNQRPPILKSYMLQIELQGLAEGTVIDTVLNELQDHYTSWITW